MIPQVTRTFVCDICYVQRKHTVAAVLTRDADFALPTGWYSFTTTYFHLGGSSTQRTDLCGECHQARKEALEVLNVRVGSRKGEQEEDGQQKQD